MSQNFKDAQLTYFNQDLQLPSKVYGIFLTTASLTYTSIATGATQTQTTSLRGVRAVSGAGTPPNIEPGDFVIAVPTTTLGAGIAQAGSYISGANTLTVALTAAATATPGAITFQIFIVKMGQNDGINS
jgi:hypothetical protein